MEYLFDIQTRPVVLRFVTWTQVRELEIWADPSIKLLVYKK